MRFIRGLVGLAPVLVFVAVQQFTHYDRPHLRPASEALSGSSAKLPPRPLLDSSSSSMPVDPCCRF